MKYISHRGNTNGSNSMENNPEYIEKTLKTGYDVEVDVWKCENNFYLGHDEPTYQINRYFLQNQKLWVHCKNIEAHLDLFQFQNINCFFHDQEEIVMTSRGYLWAHPRCSKLNNKTVIVQPDSRNYHIPPDIFAICSDYVSNFQPIFSLPFDLLIIDIDGVMTDGTKMYDREAKVFGKNYCDLDFTAIKRFMSAGVKVCFLSGDRTVNMKMAESRKITFFHNSPGIDKADMFMNIKNSYGANKVAYVGDDYYDIGIMNLVDYAFCPRTSFSAVKKFAEVINVDAGKGVIAGIYDKFEEQISYVFPIDSADVNPK
jgi:YrbI family 3-deoxy-D-manno-octulosonate 8-phosphate phosphatase